jgi:murein DD-endopeptidase MepM/ murein hydrolase activator NlpD
MDAWDLLLGGQRSVGSLGGPAGDWGGPVRVGPGLGASMPDFGGMIRQGAGLVRQSQREAGKTTTTGRAGLVRPPNRANDPEFQANPAAMGFAPALGDTGQAIVLQAVRKFGPQAGPVVAAVLQVESGLGGAIGDTDRHPAGSHGPFQFYGGGGQLNNYAAALGVDLETAGRRARADPFGGAQWAFNTSLGQALQQGIAAGHTGEVLLQDVLRAQNPGVFRSPPHYERYASALRTMAQNAQGGVVAAPAAPDAAGRVFPVPQYRGAITSHGGVQGGMDIMATEGTPVVAMQRGQVVGAGTERIGGNYVMVQGADGLTYYYAHLRDAPMVRAGQTVAPGQPIGLVGRTGNAANTPPHLHIGIGPTISSGTGPWGGTGGNYNAVADLQAAYQAMLQAMGR